MQPRLTSSGGSTVSDLESMLDNMLESARACDGQAGELDAAAESQRHDAKSLRRIVRLARLGRRVDRTYAGNLEEASLVVIGPGTTEHINRLAEKGGLSQAQVLKAALRHLEWKIDREAEGLFIFAGEPAAEGDEVIPEETDEPWKN